MLRWLALAVLLLSTADHWTTYLCLRNPVTSFDVSEANPLAAWLFEAIGLLPGLALDGVVTVFALWFLLGTKRLPHPIKLAFLWLVVLATGSAVTNNLQALKTLGISALGMN